MPISNPVPSLIAWIKANKLATCLLALIAYYIVRSYGQTGPMPLPVPFSPVNPEVANYAADSISLQSAPMAKMAVGGGNLAIGRTSMPMNYSSGSTGERMRSEITSLALKVNDVKGVSIQIENLAKAQGGWLVDANVEAADSGSTNGTISIRVPTETLPETLAQIRGYGLRVVSEHVAGNDITDQYQNVTAQLEILEQTKTKLQTILASAIRVQDMLDAQQQLLNMQQQIDSLQGQQKYLDESAKLSLVTTYLATDELALPVTAPGEAWRPNLVFKEAVRSLISFVYKIGNGVIWIIVFAPVWLPALVAYKWWQKRQAKR